MKKIFIIITIIFIMLTSYTVGYHQAIYSAVLTYTTEAEYEIDFNGSVHRYQY